MKTVAVAEALRKVTTTDLDFFTLLAEIYAHGYTGAVLLHCVNGVPKCAEFPSRQVRLTAEPKSVLDNAAHSP